MSELDRPRVSLPSREDMRQVAAAWEAFMAGETRGLEKVRPVIRESWQRAQRLGVDPFLRNVPVILPADKLEKEQERADLIYVTKSLFAMIAKAWEQEQLLLWLTDRHGHLVHLGGHPQALQDALAIDVIPGRPKR